MSLGIGGEAAYYVASGTTVQSAQLLVLEKTRASLVHLAVSAAVVGAVLAVVLLAWYPHPYFQALGTWTVVKVLIGVDLVLGPLLTFIVFKPKKRTLVFDLSVIAAVQIAALVYGTMIVFQERPYFTVWSVDRFEIVASRDIDFNEIPDPELAVKPLLGPRLVVASMPEDEKTRTQLISDIVNGRRPDIHFSPVFWQRFEDGAGQVSAAARPLSELRAARAEAAGAIDRIVSRHGDNEGALGFVPLSGKGRALAMIVQRDSGQPVGAVNADPWLPRTAATDEEGDEAG